MFRIHDASLDLKAKAKCSFVVVYSRQSLRTSFYANYAVGI